MCLYLSFAFFAFSLPKNSNDRDACLTLSTQGIHRKGTEPIVGFFLFLFFSAATQETTCHAYLCSSYFFFFFAFLFIFSCLLYLSIDLSYIDIDALVMNITPTYFITIINILREIRIGKYARYSMKTKSTCTSH